MSPAHTVLLDSGSVASQNTGRSLMFAAIADAYHRTKKPRDLAFNRWVARPLASVLVVAVARSRITPNQLTFASLFLFVGSAAILCAWPGMTGLLVAAAVLEGSYVVDMADGQLARYRGTSSPAGAHLDYTADELKALLLVTAAALRLWQEQAQVAWLIEGMAGAVVVATAVTLTSFLRRPEVIAAMGKHASPAAGDYGAGFEAPPSESPSRRAPVGHISSIVETIGKAIVHYPTYFWLVALVGRLDVFLHVYLFMNLAHAGRSFLTIMWRLGRRGSA